MEPAIVDIAGRAVGIVAQAFVVTERTFRAGFERSAELVQVHPVDVAQFAAPAVNNEDVCAGRAHTVGSQFADQRVHFVRRDASDHGDLQAVAAAPVRDVG